MTMKSLVIFVVFFMKIFVDSTLCPDKALSCPNWGTCCTNGDGTYNCCPYKNADCCADFIHCCPPGTHCNTTNRSCDNDVNLLSASLNWMVPHYNQEMISSLFWSSTDDKKQELEDKTEMEDNLVETVKDIPCPDGGTCGDSSTCCQTKNGTFGCCPFSNADCCADRIHCCPDGYKCDLKNRRCVKEQGYSTFKLDDLIEFPLFNIQRSEFEVETVKDVPCSDGRTCEDSSTCCRLQNGTYGCCPYSNADCCPDEIHCCPNGYKCDTVNRRCIKEQGSLISKQDDPTEFPIFNIQKDKFEHPLNWNVCYPNNLCSLSGMICCTSETSRYCCPHGTVCVKDNKRCAAVKKSKPDFFFDELLFKFKSTPLKKDTVSIVCPDHTESCPSNSTCCLMASRRYGCCPLPSATCCPDKLHCCPHGYTCKEDGCVN